MGTLKLSNNVKHALSLRLQVTYFYPTAKTYLVKLCRLMRIQAKNLTREGKKMENTLKRYVLES